METNSIQIDNNTFPDDVFRQYIADTFDEDNTGKLSQSQLDDITEIDCSNMGISSVKGIEYFKNLTNLNCDENQITSLDVSNNTELTELRCCKNQLTSLDIRDNSALTYLDCEGNQLTSLDVNNNTVLDALDCSDNPITSIDVSRNIALTKLVCVENQLTSLDVSNNTLLRELWCYTNQLVELDLSKNLTLTVLYCFENSLTSLDVSKNTALIELACRDNLLTDLDVSKNLDLTKLYCANNELRELITNKNLSLIDLDCQGNNIIELDLSKNTKLIELQCQHNQLSKLDLSNNTKLIDLKCGDNQLSSLDVSKNINLSSLYCSFNRLTQLDVSNNIQLTMLICIYNQITSLDVSKNSELGYLNCCFNQLNSLDVSNNGELTDFGCRCNQITSLDVSNNILLHTLACQGNKLTELDVTNNIELNYLYCYDNPLTIQDVNLPPEAEWLEILDKQKKPQLPSFNDLNAYFSESEIAGKKLDRMSIGKISIPSGKIIVSTADDFDLFTRPYFLKVPTGEYDVVLSVIKPDDEDGARYAAAQIRFSEAKAVRYVEGQKSIEDLSETRSCGWMNSSLVYICDVEVQDALEDFYVKQNFDHETEDYDNNLPNYLTNLMIENYQKNPQYQSETGDCLNWQIPGTDYHMPIFASWRSIGFYSLWFGYDENDNICSLILHFNETRRLKSFEVNSSKVSVESYILEHFGEYDFISQVTLSTDVQLDIAIIKPTPDRNYYTLVTMGKGTPLNESYPYFERNFDRAGLIITLPPEWDVFSDEDHYYWPQQLLYSLSFIPIENNSSLDQYSISYNGSFAENTNLSAVMSLLSDDLANEIPKCQLPEGKELTFYQVIPQFKSEFDNQIENDTRTLINRLPNGIDKIVVDIKCDKMDSKSIFNISSLF